MITPPTLSGNVNQPDIPLARFNKSANLAIKRILAAHGTPVTREQEAVLISASIKTMNTKTAATKTATAKPMSPSILIDSHAARGYMAQQCFISPSQPIG